MNPRLWGCVFWVFAALILTLLLTWIYPLQPTSAPEPTTTPTLVVIVTDPTPRLPASPTATAPPVPTEPILTMPTRTPTVEPPTSTPAPPSPTSMEATPKPMVQRG